MKNIKRIFVLFLASFLLTVSVNASLSCDIRIEETSIDPAGFDVMMPICVYKDYPDHPAGYNEVTDIGAGEDDQLRRRTTYQDAYGSGLEMVNYAYTAETADGKDVYERTGTVPVCATSLRKVVAYSTCSAHLSKAPNIETCSSKDQTTCNNDSRCFWNSTVDTPRCQSRNGNDVISATCDAGYTMTDDGICQKFMTYNYEEEVTGNVSAQTIIDKCKQATGSNYCSCHAPSAVNREKPVEYALKCPYYECEPEEVEVGACTPNFEIDGQAAYCVNPSQRFTGEFQHDTEFNVRECANSYSTVECGYANILIEGAYHRENGGISDDAINLALRLWSYHTNRVGFDKSGLANLMGDACNQGVYFMAEGDGHKRNVYEETHKYIMETAKSRFYDVAQAKIDRTGYLPDYINPAETSRAKFTGATFEAITCEGTRGVTCGPNPTYRVAFELFFNTLIGNKYMIAHLDDLYGDDGSAVPTGASIMDDPEDPNEGKWIVVDYERTDFERAMGDREEILCNPSDPDYDRIKKYCKNKVTTYDEYGNVIDDEVEAEKCLKSFGCISVTKVVAYCTPTVTGYRFKEIKVKYTNPRSSMSVRKYTACGDVSNTQEMYAFFPETIPGTQEEDVHTESHFYPGYICDDGCTDYSVRVDNDTQSCNMNDNNYDTSYSKTVKDPSLGCIVNMASEDKKRLYDFSNIYGVNTNFCRIYCSDEIEYHLADKTKSNAGRPFIYDVKDNKSAYDVDYKFSAVVSEKRSCVSEIYYDRLPQSVNWKQIYGLTTQEDNDLHDIDKGGLTWSHLFNIMYEKSRHESGRTENLNQMLYDLYNCNLYNQSVFSDRDVYQPRNNTIGNVLKYIKNIYKEANNFGFVNIGEFSDSVSYNVGANISTYGETGEGSSLGTVGINPEDIKTKVVYGNDDSFGFKGVKYCSGVDCLNYNAEEERYDYSSINHSTSEATSHGYKYPTNNYAYFEVTNEINYYNDDKFQAIPGSGSVVKGNANPELYTLDDYSYPLDKNAYNNNTCTKTDDDKMFCPVIQTLNISTYQRATVSDPLQTEIRNNTFKCYVEVDPPTVIVCPPNEPNCNSADSKYKSRYRNVDPSNLFPNDVEVPDNWDTDEGREAREQIESTADLLKTTNDLLEYSITLNPDQISAVREYNRKNGGYSNEKIYECDPINDKGYYTNCKSAFLDALRGKNFDYPDPTVLGTFNEPYTTGESEYSKRN